MSRNHKMIFNAGFTYGRMLLTAGLGLMSSRWILDALGDVDFGLFSVIGGIMGFLTFLNISMASSVQRHFAYAIGSGNQQSVLEWFNAALLVHLLMAASLLLVGLPLGFYLVDNVLNIPLERFEGSKLVLVYVLIATVVNIATVPVVAMYTATQRIGELALFALISSVLNFALAWELQSIKADRFLFYGFWLALINISIPMLQVFRALSSFEECKIVFSHWLNKEKIKEIFAFAGWTLFGVLGNLSRSHGLVMLINYFFGPRVNSALGIANQLAGQAEQISQGLFAAMAPEITASEGRGERERMIVLALQASKFSAFLSLIVILPLLSEIDFILNLWLKSVPQYTTSLCWIVLVTFFIEKLTSGYMIAVSAHGKIAMYQMSLGGILLLTLPIAYLLANIGTEPSFVLASCIITGLLCMFGRLFWVNWLLKVPVVKWVKKVLGPVFIVMTLTIIYIVAIKYLINDFYGDIFIFLGAPFVLCCVVYFFGLEINEKKFLLIVTRKLLVRFNLR